MAFSLSRVLRSWAAIRGWSGSVLVGLVFGLAGHTGSSISLFLIIYHAASKPDNLSHHSHARICLAGPSHCVVSALSYYWLHHIILFNSDVFHFSTRSYQIPCSIYNCCFTCCAFLFVCAHASLALLYFLFIIAYGGEEIG